MTDYIQPVIVVVAYDRIDSLRRLIESLQNAIYYNNDITLIISIDYSENNQFVVEYANSIIWNNGEKIVKTHASNLGLRKHIFECADYAIEYEAVIVLEDDLVVAPFFYEYTKQVLNFYKSDEKICGVALYGYEWNGYAYKKFSPYKENGDVYFGQFSCTTGQAWTKKQWEGFKVWFEENPEVVDNGKMPWRIYTWEKAWSKFFASYMVETDRYFVIPYNPLSTVFGDIGTNTKNRNLYHQVSLYMGNTPYHLVEFEEGVHYDIFFENLDLKKYIINKVHDSNVCIDLYETEHRDLNRFKYILSTRKLNYKVIEKYALDMRPHEANVFNNIYGNDIFLYDTTCKEKNIYYKRKNRILYDYAGFKTKESLIYAIENFIIENF